MAVADIRLPLFKDHFWHFQINKILKKNHKAGQLPTTGRWFLLNYSMDGEAYWLLLPSSVSLLSDGTVQPENTYFCILKVTGQVWESQKRININANHSYHQHSYPEASLNWSNNKARFSFNQPNRKRWVTKLVHVKNISHKAFLSWYHDQKGCQQRLKRHPLPMK